MNTNQWHSCGTNTVDQFLENKTEKAVELYKLLISEFQKLGDFDLHPAKTRIALNKRMRFASVNKLGKDFVNAHLVFPQRFDETLCFHKIDTITENAHVHHFKLYSKEDLTQELRAFMRMAYKIGSKKQFN
ncbi:MAG: DUF5655 domain-containing protein [Flavobacteriaceae bacterium]